MPKPGYKTITVKESVYDYFMTDWKNKTEEWKIKKGIRSFSAYVTFRLSELIEQEKKHIH